MKVPRLEELTLREKIAQTVVFRHTLFKDIEDPKTYFSNNSIGFTWPMGHSKEVYRAYEAARGNTELLGRKDDMYINLINTVNSQVRVPVMPVVDAAQGLHRDKFEDHGELPTFSSLGTTKDPELAYRYGKALGDDLYSIGFRWIWSPVADNAGKYLETRTLSTDVDCNCKMLAAFIEGVHAAGVATGAKHFPGVDPNEYRDSHFCTASYDESLEYWESTQGKEFRACIEAGTDAIMIGHTTFRAVDDTYVNGALLPCTLSYKVVHGLIRERLGFDGVLLTDACNMKGLSSIYPEDKLYVEILKAGIDVVLGPTRLDYVDVVEKAVLSGELPESRIDDACGRVLRLKEKYGVFEQGELPHPDEEERERIKENIRSVARDIAAKGITLAANRVGFLPVEKEKIKRVKIFYIGYSDNCFDNLRYAKEEFERHGAECEIKKGYESSDTPTLKDFDLIVYATFIGMHAPVGGPFFFGDECNMLRLITADWAAKSVGVSFGDPNIFFNYFTSFPSFVNCYSYNKETVEGFVRGIYGELSFTDYAPFPLNPIKRTNQVY